VDSSRAKADHRPRCFPNASTITLLTKTLRRFLSRFPVRFSAQVNDGTLLDSLTISINDTDGLIYAGNDITFSPDGDLLVLASGDETIHLWDVKTRTLLNRLQGHEAIVQSVAFSPLGNTLASGSMDGTIRLWDVEKGVSIGVLEIPTEDFASVDSLAYSPDGKFLISGSSVGAGIGVAALHLWNATDSTLVWAKDVHTVSVDDIACSPDGKILATTALNGSIYLWNTDDWTNFHTLEAHTKSVFGIDISPDGKFLASGGKDNTVFLWYIEP